MNDLLAPLLMTLDSEADTYWCYAFWMESMNVNFERNQAGMRDQLQLLRLLVKFMDPTLFYHLGIHYSIVLQVKYLI